MNEIQLEKVVFEPGRSFKLFSPRLRNTFLWHYHPEFELVYVEADAGIRHVGTHISTYTQSDLVFIGGNLPHLNFDYRLRSDYHQIVIQLKTDFMGTAIGLVPEFAVIDQLFKSAEYGIAFTGETKLKAAEQLKQLNSLNPLDQLLQLMNIFHLLAGSNERVILNGDLTSKNFILKDKIRMGAIYEYIDAQYHRKPDVNVVAQKVNLTTPAFCRYFKRQTNMTFTEFVNQYRIERAKNLLMQNHNVSETCYAIGFESVSYFNKLFKEIVGENPSDFRRSRENKTGKD
ncbi:helix-turn-helix domain-containing protein [Mucilaginibacter xinganensis]|uniref:AraC family transcriptional regulator n=1 Tax=Mucilaginibacter xinganensis TaxID=1234841 RepID=A0A223NVM6_9SPHI|nr:AraC family transcriptional regulator [Mucilaginibacter xinganensis]ASU33591.1 AraC family transcriptional regulator [Mucilaginibacter xinganensis]